MNEFWWLASLGVGYLLLASGILWMFAKPKGPSVWLKGLLSVALMWYCLIIFIAVPQLRGWPITNLPNKGVVVAWKVIEPAVNPRESGVYLWMVPKDFQDIEKEGAIRWLRDPGGIFRPDFLDIPRSYKMPYDPSMVEQLRKEGDKQRRRAGALLFQKGVKRGTHQKKGREGRDTQKDEGGFKFKDIEELYPKEERSNETTQD